MKLNEMLKLSPGLYHIFLGIGWRIIGSCWSYFHGGPVVGAYRLGWSSSNGYGTVEGCSKSRIH